MIRQSVMIQMAWADRKTYQGKAVNAGTLAIINAANQLLRSSYFGGEKSNLTLTQGGYNRGGVSASAGTHDGGGAIDITAHNWKNREKVFRLLGVAMWDRPTLPGVWSHHIHGIVCGDGTASAGAKRQVTAYYKRRNGLANNGTDRGYKMLVFPLFVDPAKSVGKPGVRYLKQDFTSREQPTTKAKSRGLIKKGSKFTVVAVVNVSGNYWAINVDGKFVPTSALTTKKPSSEEIKVTNLVATWRVTADAKQGLTGPSGSKKTERESNYKLKTTQTAVVDGTTWYITQHNTWYDSKNLVPWEDTTEYDGSWKVTANGKLGFTGPGGKQKTSRDAGYHLFTTSKIKIDDTVWYITKWGTWYDENNLVPWIDTKDTIIPESKHYVVNANPFLWGLAKPGSGNEKKVQRPNGSKFTSIARATLANKEEWVQGADGFWSSADYVTETSQSLDINIGTINVIRWRLGTKNVRGVGSFKRGLDYSKRLPGFAKMQKEMAASVIGTVESGQYADANELSKAFGKTWRNVLHGDNAGDLTQAIHWDSSKRKMVAEGKYTTYGSHHNWATWVILEDIESHVLFMVVCYHAEYRTRGTKSATVYDKDRERQTNVLASKAQNIAKAQAKLLGVKHIPIVYVGDFNQDKDDFYDGPGKAMTAAGNVDTETVALSKTGPSNTFPNIDGLKSSPRRFDRIFVKKGTPVAWMRTVFGPPNTDHNGVSISVILSND